MTTQLDQTTGTYIGGRPTRASDAFHGQWVRRGMVMVPVIPDEPEPDAFDEPPTEPLVDILERNFANTPIVEPVTGFVCECGCLLRHPDELCPACVIPWCLKQEAAHFWAMFERANRAGDGERMVAEARRRVA